MDPKFKCPFCGREVRYESEAGRKSVTIDGIIRWNWHVAGWWLEINNTFCSLEHLFAYISQEMS